MSLLQIQAKSRWRAGGGGRSTWRAGQRPSHQAAGNLFGCTPAIDQLLCEVGAHMGKGTQGGRFRSCGGVDLLHAESRNEVSTINLVPPAAACGKQSSSQRLAEASAPPGTFPEVRGQNAQVR